MRPFDLQQTRKIMPEKGTGFYFSNFENRTPPSPTPYSHNREFIWQILATATIATGAWYIQWRWSSSLNPEAWIFSITVALAETLAYFGLILFFFNLWSTKDTPKKAIPPDRKSCSLLGSGQMINIDIFITTYNEDPHLVALSIEAAKAVIAPPNVNIRILVLDDGNRPTMANLSKYHEVKYLSRLHNTGFKAGNLKHGFENTCGDFVAICDADTRLLPNFIINTLGYFQSSKVAWVQTPHWFYDIPKGRSLVSVLQLKLGRSGWVLGKLITMVIGKITIGKDPFSSNPGLFFDVIQRKRNRDGASFCCGAASIHRREAIMSAAINEGRNERSAGKHSGIQNYVNCTSKLPTKLKAMEQNSIRPYKFHVSEDFYTSIRLHREKKPSWSSVYHPDVEAKMLSPQSLEGWAIQNFKYAGGALDICFHDNPIFQKGLSFPQRMYYAATFWSYLSPIWISVLLIAPILTMATGIAPVESYSADFYLRLIPLLLLHELAVVLGCWGHNAMRGKRLSVASFALILTALAKVLRRQEISFPPTPKTRTSKRKIRIILPHILLILATFLAFFWGLAEYLSSPDPTILSALIINGFWGLNNIYSLWLLVQGAFWHPKPAYSTV